MATGHHCTLFLVSALVLTDEGTPLDMNKQYTLGVKSYLKEGKDGYEMLEHSKLHIDEEDGVVLDTLIRNQFRILGKKLNERQIVWWIERYCARALVQRY